MPDAISFGDIVQVRAAPETDNLGIVGRQGRVFGLTTPSSTGIAFVGESSKDLAINVFFDELEQDVWLAEELLTFVSHGAGQTMSLDGVPGHWARAEDGSWQGVGTPREPNRRPWWRFWR